MSVLALVAACQSSASQADFDALKLQVAEINKKVSARPDEKMVNKLVDDKLTIVDPAGTSRMSQTLWKIQPGLGSIMIEFNMRMANSWFAAQAGNWNMVRYQVDEMISVQEVAQTTRPKRAEALKKFTAEYLEPLMKAAEAKDLTAFNAQYPRSIGGCNSCHGKETASDFPDGFSFVRVVPPTEAATQNLDWKGALPPVK